MCTCHRMPYVCACSYRHICTYTDIHTDRHTHIHILSTQHITRLLRTRRTCPPLPPHHHPPHGPSPGRHLRSRPVAGGQRLPPLPNPNPNPNANPNPNLILLEGDVCAAGGVLCTATAHSLPLNPLLAAPLVCTCAAHSYPVSTHYWVHCVVRWH